MGSIDNEIKKHLPEEELLCQLAEECCELVCAVEEMRETEIDSDTDEVLSKLVRASSLLSKAALKLRRALDGTNPTPKTEEEARADLIEEAADVYNVLGLLLDATDQAEIYGIIQKKKARWIGRLEENAVKHLSEETQKVFYGEEAKKQFWREELVEE